MKPYSVRPDIIFRYSISLVLAVISPTLRLFIGSSSCAMMPYSHRWQITYTYQ